MKSEPRVVVDVNIFISGIITITGAPYRLLEEWRDHAFTLISSEELLVELIDVLSRPKIQKYFKLSQSDMQKFIDEIRNESEICTMLHRVPITIRDPKDEIILATALSGVADYLVTGDKDLLVLAGKKALGKLKIVTVNDFLSELHHWN